MGAGLGFPVGDSAPLRFHPQPPIFQKTSKTLPSVTITRIESDNRRKGKVAHQKAKGKLRKWFAKRKLAS